MNPIPPRSISEASLRVTQLSNAEQVHDHILSRRWLLISKMPTAEPVPSPCVSVCALDEHGVCTGCARSVEEIAGWTQFTPSRQREVWINLLQRRALKSQPLQAQPTEPNKPSAVNEKAISAPHTSA